MNKELEIITEYIEKIEEFEKKTEKQYPTRYMSKELCIAIKEKLQRLEAIDNANPSKALESLKNLGQILGDLEIDEITMLPKFVLSGDRGIKYKIVEQYILKAQEQEKVLNEALKLNGEWTEELDDKNEILNIIKEKKVDIEYLSKCNNVKEYNAHWCYEIFYLTQQEFDLLKRWLDE